MNNGLIQSTLGSLKCDLFYRFYKPNTYDQSLKIKKVKTLSWYNFYVLDIYDIKSTSKKWWTTKVHMIKNVILITWYPVYAYKKLELHACELNPGFWWVPCCSYFYFPVMCFCFCLFLFCLVLNLILPLSLDCPLLAYPSRFFSVYLEETSFKRNTLNSYRWMYKFKSIMYFSTNTTKIYKYSSDDKYIQRMLKKR